MEERFSKNEESKKQDLKKYIPLLANIYTIFAVIFLDWKIFEILFVYFSETIIFLYLSLIKVYFLKIPTSKKIGQTFLYVFILGIFYSFVGAVLLLYYFAEIEKTSPNLEVPQILNIIFSKSYFIGLLLFTATYLYGVFNFIKEKIYLETNEKEIIKVPFIRIWILMLLVIVGLFMFKTTSIYLLIAFLILKIGIDILFARKK